ncbi:MAG: hypothetical protein J6S75_05135, partial [Thermoguttaceae bacterium]|nr:hypothetical protein [Thermoguttaceae bacterium]
AAGPHELREGDVGEQPGDRRLPRFRRVLKKRLGFCVNRAPRKRAVFLSTDNCSHWESFSMKYRFGLFAAVLCAMVFCLSVQGAQVTIDSPRKLVQGVVTVDGGLSLDLNFCGRTVLVDSPLGLTFEDGAYGPLALLRTETRQINSRWETGSGAAAPFGTARSK